MARLRLILVLALVVVVVASSCGGIRRDPVAAVETDANEDSEPNKPAIYLTDDDWDAVMSGEAGPGQDGDGSTDTGDDGSADEAGAGGDAPGSAAPIGGVEGRSITGSSSGSGSRSISGSSGGSRSGRSSVGARSGRSVGSSSGGSEGGTDRSFDPTVGPFTPDPSQPADTGSTGATGDTAPDAGGSGSGSGTDQSAGSGRPDTGGTTGTESEPNSSTGVPGTAGGSEAPNTGPSQDIPAAVAYADGVTLAPDRPPSAPIKVVEDLSNPSNWRLYEQIIPFRPTCYQLGLADAAVTDVGGETALALSANATGSTKSNHALLGRFITSTPVELTRHRLTVSARLDGSSAAQTQTGPELSVQITARMSDGRYLTAVFGVQQVVQTGVWQVLTGGSVQGAWTEVGRAKVQPDTWYEITLDFDTRTNRYERLTVKGPNGFSAELDDLRTVWEDKGVDGEATWVTLDVENLFTCDSPEVMTTTVSYRDLAFQTVGG